ncbi:heme A synthase [Bacillus sp. M6-12]|uniref:COX15/CtaA family protein n=1 Tax=Bacillus sp. M6-12 TaxID=2054166 RepID=UPI000C75BB66|nr:heme A synthase [Bacillus sp. M6-12]PLS16549.1 heme A synthase [Bacillus sp. M6-12]
MQRALKWFAVFTSIGMLLILLGGALVTKTESGMGCGNSWPLCNGKLVPLPEEITPEMIIELAHRLVSGGVGFMVLILSVWSWKTIGHIRETKFLSVLSFFFLLLQGLIGAAAVMWGQSKFVLAVHFGVSLVSFAAVLLLTLLIFEVDKKFDAEKVVIDSRMKYHTIGIISYSFIVVYSGALVRHLNASLVCLDWPLCENSSSFMPGNLHQWVQMGHRAAAGLIFIWIGYVTYIAVRHYKHQKVVYGGWIVSFILVTLQVISGAFIIFSRVNLYIALAHALFISCLFGVLSYMLLLTSRSKRNAIALDEKAAAVKPQDRLIPPVTAAGQ